MYRSFPILAHAILLTACLAVQWAAAQETDLSEPRFLPRVSRLKVDAARAAEAGIRAIAGQHVTLYTDLPPSAEIDVYPQMFDQAAAQWCRYFEVSPKRVADWHVLGFLMKKKAAFQRAGLLPDNLPPFANGYERNFEFWLYDQPSDYYRRHLFLHEGTHAFMNTILGACGPPWFSEGLAEMLGTHHWQDGHLTLGYMPRDRDEVPMWGRVRIIQDAVAARQAKRLREVLDYPVAAHQHVEAYAWSWAAVWLLEHHPRYHERFHEMLRHVTEPDLPAQIDRLLEPDWQQLSEEWQVMVVNMEYGYDVPRSAIDFAAGRPLPSQGAQVTVAADHGWQSSGLRLEAGRPYHLSAAGRYAVAQQPKTWWCEPNGVTIRYYKGQPLGVLMAAVRPDAPPPGSSSALLRPVVIGLSALLTPPQSGTLYLKINDSPAELSDNSGTLSVKIE
jgi:hypothetical protein